MLMAPFSWVSCFIVAHDIKHYSFPHVIFLESKDSKFYQNNYMTFTLILL